MKAELDKTGLLLIISESTTEDFAIKQWFVGRGNSSKYPLGYKLTNDIAACRQCNHKPKGFEIVDKKE